MQNKLPGKDILVRIIFVKQSGRVWVLRSDAGIKSEYCLLKQISQENVFYEINDFPIKLHHPKFVEDKHPAHHDSSAVYEK